MKKHSIAQPTSYESSFPKVTFYGGILGFVFSLGFAVFYYFSGFPLIEVEFNLLGCLFSLISIIVGRWKKHYTAAAHLVTLCLFISFFGPALVTGGINSSSMVWLVMVPVVAALMAGRSASLIWSLITLAALVLIMLLDQVPAINLTIKTTTSVDRFIDLGCVMVVMMLSTWLNENIKRHSLDQLEKIQMQLELSNKELESFSYSVSHDLRTPLRAIDGFSRILQEDFGPALDKEAKSYLDRIQASSIHMAQLIDDLLKLSRVSHCEMWVINVDLCNLVRESLLNLKTAQPGRDVQIVMPEKLVVEGDLNLLRISINNLISNAWKFTGKTDGAKIELGSTMQGKTRVIYIKDNGAGFEMAHADKLFAPFQRLHTASDFDGTGIGLSIVKRIIQRHSGTIWAESSPGEGAAFYFTLFSIKS